MVEWIDGLSIQFKLIFSYVIIILVPIVIFSWYLFNQMYTSKLADATRNSEYLLETEKNSIINKIESIENTTQIVSSDKLLKKMLENTAVPEVAELLDFREFAFQNLLNLTISNPSLTIRVFTANPNVPEFWPIIFQEKRIQDKPWPALVKKQAENVRWQIDQDDKELTKRYEGSSATRETYVMALRTIRNDYSGSIGVMQLSVQIEDFFTNIFSSVQDPNSQLMVIDRDGRVYTNKQSRFYNDIGISEIKSQFSRHAGEGSSFSFTYNGQPYLCIQTAIDKLDVHVLNLVSMKGAISQITRWRNTIIAATIVLIVLLSLISYFLQSIILKKLKILRDSMKKVRKGNFQVEIPVNGKDEVGELANNFRQMMKKMNELIVEAVNRQASAKEAELKSLRNQIDSHFLYNTLENLKMMAEIEGQYILSDALTSLGGMMRYNLRWTSNHVRLQEEISHIQNYMAIMNIRYNDRLSLKLDIPAPFLEQEVLKMSLQPIVENAVKHGMNAEGAEDGLTVTLRAYSRGDQMLLEVEDDGTGMSPARLLELNLMIRMEDAEYQERRNQLPPSEREGSGIGLRNVDQRIVMYYGKEYGIRAESEEGRYTRVIITLPYLILTGGNPQDAQIIDRR